MASLEPHQGKLGSRLAAHLLRRTSYNAGIARVRQLAELPASEAVLQLMQPNTFTVEKPIDPKTGQPWIDGTVTDTLQGTLRNYVRSWFLNEMRNDQTIHTKMMFFLHKCWVVNCQENTSEKVFDYLALLKFYSVKSFKQLAIKMTMDNMMLSYLNNTSNNKGAPNENYAREFLELFTIGKGPQIAPGNYTHYTEDDVIAAAKLLTGFKTSTRGDFIDPDTGIPTGRVAFAQHNTENKTFSVAFGNTTITGAKSAAEMPGELAAFVQMVFAQRETARLYARRLYRYFVSARITQEIEDDIIEGLATQLMADDYEPKNTIYTLLTSLHFYDADDSDNKDEILGGIIKSPLEIFLGATNYFDIAWPSPTAEAQKFYTYMNRMVINGVLDAGGMSFLAPYDVAGYSAYYQEPGWDKAWFTSNTIISRYKIGEMLQTGRFYLGGGDLKVAVDLPDYIRNSGYFSDPADAATLVDEMVQYLFPEKPDADRQLYFLDSLLLGVPPEDWTYEWENYVQSGDDTEVSIGLKSLMSALLYSQEYQLL